MENSASESEEQKSFQSPPRRRRSTFFERRDSLVPQNFGDTDVITLPKQVNDKSENNDKQLSKYYEQLLLEKEQWKREVNNRRHKYHDFRQQYQIAAKSSSISRISYNALSNEDIEYLKRKPNLSKLVDAQQKLHKSVRETRALYRRASELDSVILDHCENKIAKITDHILENSTLEAVD